LYLEETPVKCASITLDTTAGAVTPPEPLKSQTVGLRLNNQLI
jgi:hypothetical protein